jgi:hypothetical protein
MRMSAPCAAFNQISAKKLFYSTLRRLSVSSARIISFPFLLWWLFVITYVEFPSEQIARISWCNS